MSTAQHAIGPFEDPNAGQPDWVFSGQPIPRPAIEALYDPLMELTVEREAASDGRQVLTLAGSLDLSSKAAVLEVAAQAFAAPGMTGLVLDLAAVSFIDSSGIGMMVELAGDAKDAERAFALRQPSKQVARILQVTGLSDAWSVEG